MPIRISPRRKLDCTRCSRHRSDRTPRRRSCPKTIALFKTPGLRDLGHSAPYLHTGQSSTLEAVLFFYRFTSGLAREQSVRNSDPEMARIFIVKEAQAPLAAFLRSLNEEFE
jgi:cytochrome c peroxidase